MAEQRPSDFANLLGEYQFALANRDSAAHRIASAADPATRDEAILAFKGFEVAASGPRRQALALAATVTGQPSRDVNYVMPRFVLTHLPIGLVGVFIAAVLAAAMNAIAAELNSLATTSVIDFYRRWVRSEGTDAHFLMISRVATAIWGLLACMVALYAATLGSLIEVVNRFGSVFYGSILGVFLLAMIPWTRGRGAFVGLIAGMSAVLSVILFAPAVSFLWHNVLGAMTVVIVGCLLSLGRPSRAPA